MRENWQLWQDKWFALLGRFNVDAEENGMIQLMLLYDMYSAKGRMYHNMRHVEACLGELERLPPMAVSPVLEMSVWLHDVVYEPYAGDNEDRSALFAEVIMLSLGRNDVDTSLALSKLILATAHRVPGYALEPQQQIIRDIDLAWFGHSKEEFDWNNYCIRLEYSSYPDGVYNPARIDVLQSFLNGPRIYYTKTFHDLYEGQARENLTREIKRLKNQLKEGKR